MKYSFLATTKEGKVEKGVLEAVNSEEALKELSDRGLLGIYLKKERPKKKWPEISLGKVSSKEKLFFVKHLSVMMKAGLTVGEALEVLKDQAEGKFKKIIADILTFVRKGNTLSSGLTKYPKVFSLLSINLIEAGEASGTLEQNLKYLSIHLEKSEELRKKIKGAMMYPILVLSATIGISLGLATLVLPKITKFYKTLDVELPLLTRGLLWVANLFTNYGWWISGGLILGLLFLILLFRQRFIRPFSHRFILILPIISRITREVQLALFSRVLGTLIKSGLPIDRSLRITQKTIDNIIYHKRIAEILEAVDRGIPISETMAFFERDFPKIVSQMINVGERTGELDNSLLYLAEFYEAEVDNTTKNLANILEPILLVIVGVLVGTVALSIISPIYQLIGTLRLHP